MHCKNEFQTIMRHYDGAYMLQQPKNNCLLYDQTNNVHMAYIYIHKHSCIVTVYLVNNKDFYTLHKVLMILQSCIKVYKLMLMIWCLYLLVLLCTTLSNRTLATSVKFFHFSTSLLFKQDFYAFAVDCYIFYNLSPSATSWLLTLLVYLPLLLGYQVFWFFLPHFFFAKFFISFFFDRTLSKKKNWSCLFVYLYVHSVVILLLTHNMDENILQNNHIYTR